MAERTNLPRALLRPPDRARRAEIEELFGLLEPAKRLQVLARKHKIADIFQDNGGKILQALIMLGLSSTGSREGNDAADADGHEYELKTANIRLVSGFSTHHHLNEVILAKYRQVPWIFSFYEDIELIEIWAMMPAQLEPLFEHWECKLQGRAFRKGVLQPRMPHINNPKIPLRFVKESGNAIFTARDVAAYRR